MGKKKEDNKYYGWTRWTWWELGRPKSEYSAVTGLCAENERPKMQEEERLWRVVSFVLERRARNCSTDTLCAEVGFSGDDEIKRIYKQDGRLSGSWDLDLWSLKSTKSWSQEYHGVNWGINS